MASSCFRSRLARVRPGALAALVPVALVAAACTSGANASTSTTQGPAKAPPPFQGAIGQVAALAPPTMEVQSPASGQTTVSWTSSTMFEQTVTVAASSVAAGDCVVVTGTPSSPGSSSSTISARSISIIPASSTGSCTEPTTPGGARVFRGGFGAGGGRGLGGGGFRTSNPGGGSFPSGTFPQLATAFGKVTSTSSSGLVVHGVERTAVRRTSSSTSSSTTTTTPPQADITITSSSSTNATQQQSATASDLAVGSCVTAAGPSDSTGAVTATSISIRPSTNGSCFGGFGQFGGPGAGGGTSGATASA